MKEDLIKYGEIMRTYELGKDEQKVENVIQYYRDLLKQNNIKPFFKVEEEKIGKYGRKGVYYIEIAYVLNLYIKKEDFVKAKSILIECENNRQDEDIGEFECKETKKMKQYVKYFITTSMVIAMIIEFGVILINGVNIGIPEIIILIILLITEFYILIFYWRKKT